MKEVRHRRGCKILPSDVGLESGGLKHIIAVKMTHHVKDFILSEFQSAAGVRPCKGPATLRTQVLLCGATLGRAGHNLAVHMSKSWGGIGKRIRPIDNMIRHHFATSADLDPDGLAQSGFYGEIRQHLQLNFGIWVYREKLFGSDSTDKPQEAV